MIFVPNNNILAQKYTYSHQKHIYNFPEKLAHKKDIMNIIF